MEFNPPPPTKILDMTDPIDPKTQYAPRATSLRNGDPVVWRENFVTLPK